jgi:hypothetical protein
MHRQKILYSFGFQLKLEGFGRVLETEKLWLALAVQ